MEFFCEKDKIDIQIVIEYLVEKGFDEVVMFFCIGKRFDYVFVNISFLYYLFECNIKGVIVDENNIIMMIRNKIKIYGKKG